MNNVCKVWECKYCHQIIESRRKLYKHYKICDKKLSIPTNSLGRTINFEGIRKSHETIRRKFLSGELKNEGKPVSPETRAKLAESMIRRKNLIKCQCNYNEDACKFIDELNNKNNWNLQHAKNGGEYKVGPYHVDGFDKRLNIVFEYDENKSNHNKIENILRDKCRQAYIIEKLNCDFWRYSERYGLLYKVDKDKNLEEIKILQEQLPKVKIRQNKIKTKKKDKVGKGKPRALSDKVWEERKDMILNSSVDLHKYGWVKRVGIITGYSKRVIEETIKRFPKEFELMYFRRKLTRRSESSNLS